jgi:hypothetical protein
MEDLSEEVSKEREERQYFGVGRIGRKGTTLRGGSRNKFTTVCARRAAGVGSSSNNGGCNGSPI